MDAFAAVSRNILEWTTQTLAKVPAPDESTGAETPGSDAGGPPADSGNLDNLDDLPMPPEPEPDQETQ